MPDLTIAVEARTEFGKGAARRIRREDKIPAVLYGHGTDPQHIILPGHQTMLALKVQNALLTIKQGKEEQLALVKDVQRDPVRQTIEHVDLLIIRKGEKVQVDIALHVIGEPVPGTMHFVEANTIAVEADATNIPEALEADITDREIGNNIVASELTLPEGVELLIEPDTTLVVIADATVVAEEETDEDGTAEVETEGNNAEGDDDSE